MFYIIRGYKHLNFKTEPKYCSNLLKLIDMTPPVL